jgi:hypothetical protein
MLQVFIAHKSHPKHPGKSRHEARQLYGLEDLPSETILLTLPRQVASFCPYSLLLVENDREVLRESVVLRSVAIFKEDGSWGNEKPLVLFVHDESMFNVNDDSQGPVLEAVF